MYKLLFTLDHIKNQKQINIDVQKIGHNGRNVQGHFITINTLSTYI